MKACVVPADVFLQSDQEIRKYYKIYKRNIGRFNHHGLASMPYVMEECLRTGLAINRYARNKYKGNNEFLTFYGISTADGTHTRSVAEYARGKIYTLTDSAHISNKKEFNRLLNHKHSFFHLGNFSDITPYYLKNKAPKFFRKGFDIIWENTAFQMYSNKRDDQISYVKRVLKKDGIIIFLEKMSNKDKDIYRKMEEIKDSKFKSKFFSTDDIDKKKNTILSEMEKGQVTLKTFLKVSKRHFKYVEVIWNSTNFYEIVASDDENSINKFVSFLPNKYVPKEFIQ